MSVDPERLLAQVRARLMPNRDLCPGLFGVAGESAYYVPEPLFRDIFSGLSAREAARALACAGVLRKNRKGGYKHCRALPGGRPVRVYVLQAEALGLPPAPTVSSDWRGP